MADVSDYEQAGELADEIAEVMQADVTENAFTELYGMTQKMLNRHEYRNFSFV